MAAFGISGIVGSAFMGLFDRLFRARTPVRDTETLSDFVDQNAAFLVQKGIYEYSRARAGHYAKVLFAEEGFLRAVEESRWRAYPLGLAMVGELVEGVIRDQTPEDGPAIRQAVFNLVLSVFDRYPVPNALTRSEWTDKRVDLDRRLHLIATHARKMAKDIPEPFARPYFNCLPIHPQLRGSDYPTIRNYLRITMCNIHDELTRRMDIDATIKQLRAPGQFGQIA